MVNGVVLDRGGAGLDKDVREARLSRACLEFESLFIAHMLKAMRKTVSEGGLIRESNEGKIFKSMFDEKLALEIAQSGGIGLGEILFEQIKE
jgi:flagellar protein FlgJ